MSSREADVGGFHSSRTSFVLILESRDAFHWLQKDNQRCYKGGLQVLKHLYLVNSGAKAKAQLCLEVKV